MVLVYSDDKKLVFELLSKAKELAKELGKKTIAVAIGKECDSLSKEYIAHGANNVFIVETEIDHFKAEEYSGFLENIIKETKSETILIGSNKNGKELASRLAGRLNAGCIIDCINVYIKNKKLTVERVVYSGNAIAEEQFNSKPEIVTIPPKVFNPLEPNSNHKGEVIKKKYEVQKYNSKIIKIIVSCGRGFKKKDDIKLVSDLAEALKGKTVGCSRPIAADLKWLSEDHWIGLSGHKVKPKLYIAAGISGQIQHIAGMRDSGVIVAINKDPEALIFKSADYGIVGDLYEVLPKLTNAVKEKLR